jgi:hypothetical protein
VVGYVSHGADAVAEVFEDPVELLVPWGNNVEILQIG